MDLVPKATILDSDEMALVLRRLAGEIVESEHDRGGLMLIGIRTRGVPMAESLAAEIERLDGARPPLGVLDITLYRDDLSMVAAKPLVKESTLPDDIEGRLLVLCDDVLYTGRTVRAALDALLAYGRPQAVRLAVLIDRGGRELPIQADFVGRKVQASANEVIRVRFESIDGASDVQLLDRRGAA